METNELRPLVEPNWYPPEQWREGEVVVTEMLPWYIGREFRLGVAIVDAEGNRLTVRLASPADHAAYVMDGGSWLRLQAFRWHGEMPLGKVVMVDEHAALPVSAQATFGGQITLSGLELVPDSPRPGDQLHLRLSWSRTGGPIDRDFTLFVHLLDAAGQRVAQADGMPNYLGELPTTLWQQSVPVLDEHILSLPQDLAPGTYRLSIGWYDIQTGERLPLEDGADSLDMAVVRVR